MEKDLSAKEKIEEVLVESLKSGEFPDVSAADIIKRAGVSKSTFYRHYKDIFEIYEQLVDGFIERCEVLINKVFIEKTLTVKQIIWILVKNGIHKDNEFFYAKDLILINHSIDKGNAQVIEILYDKIHALIVKIAKRVCGDDEAAQFGATFILNGNIIPIFANLHINGKLKLDTVLLSSELFEMEVEKWKQQYQQQI